MEAISSTVIDEAFERMAASSAFELANGFVNHGPMVVEALAVLGLGDRIDKWARRFERVPGPGVEGIAGRDLDLESALGNYGLLAQWIGYLRIAIEEQGWQDVVAVWVPRLMPSLSTKLFHGAIHTGHSVRALTAGNTPTRRTELARALGYWAARYRPGQSVMRDEVQSEGELRIAVTIAAGRAARYYLAEPSIRNLHGVTGAMAIELLVDHIPPEAGHAALAQLSAEHAALYQGMEQQRQLQISGIPEEQLAFAAEASRDVHTVKLVEACRRGRAISGDPVFSAAAEMIARPDSV